MINPLTIPRLTFGSRYVRRMLQILTYVYVHTLDIVSLPHPQKLCANIRLDIFYILQSYTIHTELEPFP